MPCYGVPFPSNMLIRTLLSDPEAFPTFFDYIKATGRSALGGATSIACNASNSR